MQLGPASVAAEGLAVIEAPPGLVPAVPSHQEGLGAGTAGDMSEDTCARGTCPNEGNMAAS